MKKLLIAMSVAGLMVGCSNEPKKVEVPTVQPEVVAPASLNNEDMYVAYVDGRENVFYDAELFVKFLEEGETSFRKTYIGEGTNGMTLVYGLTKDDKKKSTNPAEQMLKGELKPAESFYAEVYNADHNRFYVFSAWESFDAYLKNSIDNFRYSDIAAGPKGETVVYVAADEAAAKKIPVEAMAKFKATHGLK
ncbi:hypothetical protein [Thiosulfativibrio zosterae]|uniref:Lipoprotein n=1 Tax=Thiosulfativibrio zosterae TaxID=2675053 RepID=A0A6F8PLH6_9GAMM|nr:hypothetical protein [Thiosulfativibrio zosterae]BBP42897.1 hypothetical protein THMIRHAT_06430 [Thiosulfativibrio zosterae]